MIDVAKLFDIDRAFEGVDPEMRELYLEGYADLVEELGEFVAGKEVHLGAVNFFSLDLYLDIADDLTHSLGLEFITVFEEHGKPIRDLTRQGLIAGYLVAQGVGLA